METKNKDKKEGVVPKEEISGSDADKAYDQEGNFGKTSTEENNEDDKSEQKGSDADTN
jgi:hypothetical protein